MSGVAKVRRRTKPALRPASAHDIDVALLSFCKEHWQKVAKIIGNSLLTFDARSVRVRAHAIDLRMATLVRNGRLEAKGNISEWRYSEVRFPANNKTMHRPITRASSPHSSPPGMNRRLVLFLRLHGLPDQVRQ
jgi:Protein of unknown function